MRWETYVSRNLLASTHLLLYRFKYIKPFTHMYSYVTRMSLVCTRMSSVCHSYVLVCHSYITHMYSYVIRMSLVCTRMYSYVIRMSLVCTCNWYVTRMWFYHEPYETLFCCILPFFRKMCLISSVELEARSASQWI